MVEKAKLKLRPAGRKMGTFSGLAVCRKIFKDADDEIPNSYFLAKSKSI